MLVVGSRALNEYIPIKRVIHDWDIWMNELDSLMFKQKYDNYLVKTTPSSFLYDIDGVIVEVKPKSKFETTDWQVWNTQEGYNRTIMTPFGKANIPDIQTIYDMKVATAQCIDEWKHHYDQKLIENNFDVTKDTILYQNRFEETRVRIEKVKQNKFGFFHKNQLKEQKIATIPEYIEHDRLHELIADLLDIQIPTYKRITCGDTDISKDQFDKLTYDQKLNLMMEESLVLALERWFIPQMIENGINYSLISRFYNNNEASPTYLLLKHVNIKGLIGEKDYIVDFGRDNFNHIEKIWIEAKDKIKSKGGFPRWFFDELFILRDQYKTGKQVGLHHAN